LRMSVASDKKRLVYASISSVIAGNNKAGVLMDISSILCLGQAILVAQYYPITWFFNRSSNVSLLRISRALPSSTSTSAGFSLELKLLLISKP
jgi:hypothetical protein